jgi:hypothetical protein
MFWCDKVYYRIPDLLLPAYTSMPWTVTCQHPVQPGTAVSHVSWCLKHVITRLYQSKIIQGWHAYHYFHHLIKTWNISHKRLKSLSHASNWLKSTPNWSSQWIQQSRFHNLCILKTEVEPTSIMLHVLTNTSDNWKSQIHARLNNISSKPFTLIKQNTDSPYYWIPEHSSCQKLHITSASNWNLKLVFSLWSNLRYFTQQSQNAQLQFLSGSCTFWQYFPTLEKTHLEILTIIF